MDKTKILLEWINGKWYESILNKPAGTKDMDTDTEEFYIRGPGRTLSRLSGGIK